MAGSTMWGQRKALGRRYSVDPVLLMEQQRLDNEYNLMMPRAQLAEQKRQADLNRQAQEDATKRSGMSSLVGSAGSLASTYMIGKALAPAAPATAITASNVGANTVAPATNFAMGGSVQGLSQGLGAATGTGQGVSVVPALAETGAIPTGTVASTGSAIAPATEGLGLASVPAMGYIAPAAAGFAMPKINDAISPNININTGKVMTLGLMGGEKENKVAGASMHGAGAGALAGTYILPGIGSAVGAVIGGIVGAASELFDSHICTATHKIVGMSEAEKSKMKYLKEYALEKHSGWINSYLKHGTDLVLEITAQENDLKQFYKNIRIILIEPILEEENIEKCFQIYLAVTKLLFKAYMPEFNFKEEN